MYTEAKSYNVTGIQFDESKVKTFTETNRFNIIHTGKSFDTTIILTISCSVFIWYRLMYKVHLTSSFKFSLNVNYSHFSSNNLLTILFYKYSYIFYCFLYYLNLIKFVFITRSVNYKQFNQPPKFVVFLIYWQYCLFCLYVYSILNCSNISYYIFIELVRTWFEKPKIRFR